MRGSKLQIVSLECVDSTQSYLKSALKERRLEVPVCVVTTSQSAGEGSRANKWIGIEGNLFFSFALARASLPADLPLASASIYFMFQLKETLAAKGSGVWLKWPNDLYIERKKIAGCITNIQGKTLVCGIGVNTLHAPDGFGRLDVVYDEETLLRDYFHLLEKSVSWKQIFRKYSVEFENSKRKTVANDSYKNLISNAVLQEDGSLLKDGKRIYGSR